MKSNIKLYHGSKDIIKKPIYGYGKSYNDYGLGFYCTKYFDIACEWSVDVMRDGYVNEYELDTDKLNIINLNDSKYHILNWLSLLLLNREFDIKTPLAKNAKDYLIKNFMIDYSNCDVLIGYRADDRYFSFASDFLNGAISFQQLKHAMHLGELGEQVVLISKKSFSKIKFINHYIVKKDEWYLKKINRIQNANDTYRKIYKQNISKKDIFIVDIIREKIKNDDESLR